MKAESLAELVTMAARLRLTKAPLADASLPARSALAHTMAARDIESARTKR